MTKIERTLVKEAKRAQADVNGGPRARYFAQLLLDRVQRTRKARSIEREVMRRYGRKPNRKHFPDQESHAAALDHFWRGMERVIAEDTLSSPESSLAARARARKRLNQLDRIEGIPGESRRVSPASATPPSAEPPARTVRPCPTGKNAAAEPRTDDAEALKRFLLVLDKKIEPGEV